VDTRFFDCLVDYFYVSGFFRIYRSLERTEKVRILIGLSTDRTTFNLLQQASQGALDLVSHAEAREQLPFNILRELEKADDTAELEDGVRKFIEWMRSGKMEVRVYPSEKIHAKIYIMTFVDGHIDAGRVITGSSNFSQAGKEFLSNYISLKYSSKLSTLQERQAVVFGRASSCENPVLIRLNDQADFLRVFRNQQPR